MFDGGWGHCAAYVGEVLGNFHKVPLVHQEGEDVPMYPLLAERAQ